MAKLIDKIQERVIKKLGIQKAPHIFKNFSYSIGLHLAVILIIYLSFNLGHKVKNEKKEKVVINFVMNNKDVSMNPQPFLQDKEKEVKKESEKPKEEIAEPKKEEKKPEPKKEEKKPEPKKEEKKSDPKKEEKKPEPKKKEEIKPKSKTKDKEKKTEKKPEKKIDKKSEKKPEVKKEEPKKEEVKKEEKKVEEPKKYVPKESPKETSKTESEASFTDKTIDKLDLPIRDKFNIQSQIVGCYKRAIIQFGGNKISEAIVVNIKLSKDGTIDQKNMIFKDYDRYSNPNEKEFRRGVDIVKQTISFCSPLRKMPEDKYNVWKEIDLQFTDLIVSSQ